MAISKITTNSITDDAVTTAKVNPAQTDITSVGTLTGLTVSGDATLTGDNYNVTWDKSENLLKFSDSAKLHFGTGNDLRMYHDGSNSYIDEEGTGSLFIRSSRVSIHKYTGETMINAAADGAVSLYYNDSKKLETVSTGLEVYNGSSGDSPHLILKDMNSGVTAGDFGGSLRFSTNDGNAQGVSAVIASSYANAAGGTNLSFFTGTGGNTTEKMRLHTEGCLMLGYPESGLTAPAYTARAFEAYSSTNNLYMALLHNKTSGAQPYGFFITYDTSPDNQNAQYIQCTDNTTTRFQVFNDGDVRNHDNSYGQTSDERIKSNIKDATSQWDDIKAIQVRNFERKDDIAQHGEGKKIQIGVVAQEIEKVSPKLVRETNPTKDDIKINSEFGTLYEEGDTLPENTAIGDVKEVKSKVKGVSYSVLYMKAVKALQEAMTRIETLEAKVKTLEEA